MDCHSHRFERFVPRNEWTYVEDELGMEHEEDCGSVCRRLVRRHL